MLPPDSARTLLSHHHLQVPTFMNPRTQCTDFIHGNITTRSQTLLPTRRATGTDGARACAPRGDGERTAYSELKEAQHACGTLNAGCMPRRAQVPA